MRKKLYRCSAPTCGRRYAANTGGTIGDEPLCPGHYKQRQRDPDGELRPLADRSEKLLPIKVFVSADLLQMLGARAYKAGQSLSAYCAGLLDS